MASRASAPAVAAPHQSVATRRATSSVAAATVTESPASTSSVKLPATHLDSSKRALEQLKESQINRCDASQHTA